MIDLSILFSVFVRGFFACLLMVSVVYLYLHCDRALPYNRCFAVCCLGVLISLILGTLHRFVWPDTFLFSQEQSAILEMALSPFFVLFFYSLICQYSKGRTYNTILIVMELPIIVAFMLTVLPQDLISHAFLLQIVVVYAILGAVVFCIYSFFVIRRYKALLSEAYSDTENRSFVWCIYVFLSLFVYFIIYLTWGMSEGSVSNVWQQSFVLCYAIVVFVYILYSLSHQLLVYSDIMEQIDLSGRNKLSDEKVRSISVALQRNFVDARAYANNDINIQGVARMVGTNVSYLSDYLNSHLHMNFNQYVNRLRVEYACQLMEETDYTMDELAHRCGFSSKAAFYRVFSIVKGSNPVDYTPEQYNMIKKEMDSDQHSSIALLLNSRERYLCQLIVQGATTDEICRKMQVTEASLRVSRSRLRQKLGLNRADSLKEYLSGMHSL